MMKFIYRHSLKVYILKPAESKFKGRTKLDGTWKRVYMNIQRKLGVKVFFFFFGQPGGESLNTKGNMYDGGYNNSSWCGQYFCLQGPPIFFTFRKLFFGPNIYKTQTYEYCWAQNGVLLGSYWMVAMACYCWAHSGPL